VDWDQIYDRLTSDTNDAVAWRALEKRVAGWARAAFWTQARHLIDDAVVDSCAAIALNIESARGAATFAGFAYGHFLNARRRLLRVELQRAGVSLDDLDLPAPPAEEGPDTEALNHLQRALATLPPRERTAVTLRYFDELSSAGIAAALGVSRVNARRIVFNGLRRLRVRMRSRPWHTDPPVARRPFAVAAAYQAR
jgi:RNA polymerase sigma factor (sigma-70 family)